MRFDVRPIICVVGLLVAILGITMLIPAAVDLIDGRDEWAPLFQSALISIIIGGGMFLATRGARRDLTTRQGFVMTSAAWTALSAFAAIPFYLAGVATTYGDAFFESVSGFTTTGATNFVGLDTMSHGILLWRGMTQFLGGLGIIVMAVAVLPALQIGGMQLFKAEAFDTPEKILPRATQLSGFLTTAFAGVTVACMFAYLAAGMSFFDAVVHAMTTVGTGGFSNYDKSLGHFDNIGIDITAVVFMILASMPFLLYVQAVQGNWKPLLIDSQVRAFLRFTFICIAAAWIIEYSVGKNEGFDAVRLAAVNITGIITGTGFATTDYEGWGPIAASMFFFAMFVGGCAGSASCGIKIFRFQIMYQAVKQYIARIIYPNRVIIRKYNGRPIDDEVVGAVFSFLFLYLLTYAVSASALACVGLDAITALSGAGTAISNVGPGLGNLIGPAGSFEPLPQSAKWILSATMLIGRLELFTVLVILSPRFWRM